MSYGTFILTFSNKLHDIIFTLEKLKLIKATHFVLCPMTHSWPSHVVSRATSLPTASYLPVAALSVRRSVPSLLKNLSRISVHFATIGKVLPLSPVATQSGNIWHCCAASLRFLSEQTSLPPLFHQLPN